MLQFLSPGTRLSKLDRAEGAHRGTLRLSLADVVAIVAIYGLVHAALRMAASPTIGQDDVIANVFAQSLEIGYWLRNPPLYDWLLWGVQQVTGPTLVGFLLLKYALLLCAAVLLYAIMLRIAGDRQWAALTALAPALCYQIGWNVHEGVTHTMTLICVLAASFYVFLGVIERGRIADYLLFGICVGLGGLAKYNYAGFLGVLVVAACFQRPLRERLVDPRILISAAVALLMVAPFYLWLFGGGGDLAVLTDETLNPRSDWHIEHRIWWTLWRPVYVTLNFLAPLLIVVPLLFPQALKSLWRRQGRGHEDADRPDIERLIFHMLLLGLVVMAAGIMVFGVQRLVARHMHPFLLLGIVWLMLQARHGYTHPRQLTRFMNVLVAAVALVLVLRALNLFVAGEPFCKKCRQLVPFDRLAAELRTGGFDGGILIAANRHIAGNMRVHFPNAVIVSLDNPKYRPPALEPADEDQVAVVWNAATDGEAVPRAAEPDLVRLGWTGTQRPTAIDVAWDHWRPRVAAKRTPWRFLVVERQAARAD